MSKKKGLGRDIEKSVEVMDQLIACLGDFHGIPIKRGLKSRGVVDEKFGEHVNEAKEKASALRGMVEDLIDTVKGAKPAASKRFACNRIVSKFLERS